MSSEALQRLARAVIETEARAVTDLLPRIGNEFEAACRIMLDCAGRIVVVGVGKSGHIGGKIAATLASTGSPAFFVHAAEANHGDLGMITGDDVVLLLSYSGESDEIKQLLPVLKRLDVALIALTGNPDSFLGRHADIAIDVSVSEEACPLGLAPTSSTTASLVMGDALAVSLLETRGFTAEDFARSHPAGQLGRRLVIRIRDLMHAGDEIPRVPDSATVSEAIVEMTSKRLGMTTVTGEDGGLAGIFTDGDLRRTLEAGLDPHTTGIIDVMTRGAVSLEADALAVEGLKLMQKKRVQALLAMDADGRLAGVINFQDLLAAGVV